MARKLRLVEVAVAAVTRGNDILTVYSKNWNSFTLPMTKRRQWEDPTAEGGKGYEEWRDAAARAAAECLGRTFGPRDIPEQPDLILADFQQSDRDGIWKRYHFQVFQIRLPKKAEALDEIIAEWHPVEVFLLDEKRRQPISKTAYRLIKELSQIVSLGGRQFP